ncbi:MAG: hypothetical protein FE78DRAFT_90948, partial [Acidomyces sp. 'richmondensis']
TDSNYHLSAGQLICYGMIHMRIHAILTTLIISSMALPERTHCQYSSHRSSSLRLTPLQN